MEFSNMRIPKTAIVLTLLAALIFPAASLVPRAAHAQTSSLEIDLSGTAFDGDFLYGIDCTSDPDNVYVTVSSLGALVAIDKDTKTPSSPIDDPDGPVVGQDFYSITGDGNGNLFVNERDNGIVWKYNIAGDSWTKIPIVEEITGNPDVTYPDTFAENPTLIQVDESPGSHGIHTYDFGMNSYGGVVFAEGYIWVGLGYNADFDDQAETNAGVTDLSFSGLARIDPDTNAVSRIPIAGSTGPTGLLVDGTDLWISDQSEDKIFKFNLSTETLTETVTLDADSAPRGMDTDGTYLYVALNKNGLLVSENSLIMKIDKADTSSQEIIDTGAANTQSGTFTVFVEGTKLFWTDQSQHMGVIDLNTNGKLTEDTTFADSNHFGCIVGSEFWWAGQGSAVVGFIDVDVEIPGGDAPGGGGSKRQVVAYYESTAREIAEIGIPSADQIGEQKYTMSDLLMTQREFKNALYMADYVCYWAGVSWDDLTKEQQVYILGSIIGLDSADLGFVPPEVEETPTDTTEEEPEPEPTPAEKITELNKRAAVITAKIDRLGGQLTVEELRLHGFDKGLGGKKMTNDIVRLFAELARIEAEIAGLSGGSPLQTV